LTLIEIKKEISRVEMALEKTKSEKLKRDYGKYLNKLKRWLKYGKFESV
jgi:hypothetical protein